MARIAGRLQCQIEAVTMLPESHNPRSTRDQSLTFPGNCAREERRGPAE